MNNKELNDKIQSHLHSATVKIDAARSAAYKEHYNSVAEWLEQSAEKVKQARVLVGRIGEDND